MPQSQMFRANVGVVVLDSRGRVLAFERASNDVTVQTDQWQLPQGGIDEGEEPTDAWQRELEEETGLSRRDVTVLGEYPDWLVYELPEHARHRGHVRGQAQKWFFVRLADGAQPDPLGAALGRGEHPEFRAFKWTTMTALAEEVWPIRKPIYDKLAEHLRSSGYC